MSGCPCLKKVPLWCCIQEFNLRYQLLLGLVLLPMVGYILTITQNSERTAPGVSEGTKREKIGVLAYAKESLILPKFPIHLQKHTILIYYTYFGKALINALIQK